ncbi:MAG: hypothetical protein FWE06_07660 [Oscillospiraceae bacterium]|nr:hypothetical protein [Oscillospiraceae bacterium]
MGCLVSGIPQLNFAHPNKLYFTNNPLRNRRRHNTIHSRQKFVDVELVYKLTAEVIPIVNIKVGIYNGKAV